MSIFGDVLWRPHPSSGKWHAYRAVDSGRSACGLTSKADPDAPPSINAPEWPDSCWACCEKLRVRPPMPRAQPGPELEPAEAEIVQGGPLDGVRLRLGIIMRPPTPDGRLRFTVIGSNYEQRKPVLASSETVRPPEAERPAWET